MPNVPNWAMNMIKAIGEIKVDVAETKVKVEALDEKVNTLAAAPPQKNGPLGLGINKKWLSLGLGIGAGLLGVGTGLVKLLGS